MSFSNDHTGNAELDCPEWPQFDIPGLEDYDFDILAMPGLPPVEDLPVDEASSSQATVQSPTPINAQPSPPSQLRRVSVVTVRRRSSARSLVTVTLEDGRKRSLEGICNSIFEAWQKTMVAEEAVIVSPGPQRDQQVSHVPHVQQALPELIYATQPSMPLAPQTSYLSNYVPTANPSYRNAGSDLQMDQQFFAPPQQQLLPMPFASSMLIARRSRRVPAPLPSPKRQAAGPTVINERQSTRRRPQPPQQGLKRDAIGGRPPLPDDIMLFANPHHLPHNDGRVPDKRGNKDTTIANDYYYSISKLDDLELPTCGTTVSYNGIEFDAGLHFTGEEFLEYLHCASQRPNRQPILRIQIQPAQYNHRYMRAGQSFKCRFRDCPDKRGTILKGQARVCISEFDDENGDWLNPFHNAGYVHLFCLEKQVNFIELCEDPSIRVVPETRSLAHEPPAKANIRLNNPMALNDVERAVVDEWLAEISLRWDAFKSYFRDPALRPRFELDQEDTLTYRLTKAHVDNGRLKEVQRKRKLEAGDRLTAHLDQFVGDVGKQVAMQKKVKNQAPKKRPRAENVGVDGTPSPDAPSKRRRVASPQHPAMFDVETQDNNHNAVGSSHHPLPETHGPTPFYPPQQASCNPPGTYNPSGPRQRRASPVAVRSPRRSPRLSSSPAKTVHSPSVTKRRRRSLRKTSSSSYSSSDARLEAELLAYLNGAGEADAEGEEDSLFGDGGRVEEIE